MPRLKRFLSEVANRIVPVTWLASELSGDNQGGKRQIKNLFPELVDVFEYPKPVELIATFIRMTTQPNDIMLGIYPTNIVFALYCPISMKEGSHGRPI